MTRPTIDVNERFAAERADQIRAAQDRQATFDQRITDGKLVPLGGGRFRVNDQGSWDNGEILTQRDGQILPEHGLDTTRGVTALYTSTPAWHGLGTVIPGGITDIDRVLRLAGIDYEVDLRPVLYQPQHGAPARMLDDQFVTVRADTGAGLGCVGKRYEVIQNRQAFEFLQDLVDSYDVIWESAGALREGRKVFVSMRLPDTVTIDANGVSDEIVPFVVAINSHDGSSLFQVVVTPWRPVCGNTERFAVRDAHTRWGVRHTRNARDRIEQARRTLGLSVDYYRKFAAEQQLLAETELAISQFRQLCDELWPPPPPEAAAQAKTRHERRLHTLTGLYRTNSTRLGSTAYAAERAITEYADWRTALRPTGALRGNLLAARATAVMEGTADDLKTRAHRRLLTRTRR
jgi:phage/plasmid-like protein (TIGR03299 family)